MLKFTGERIVPGADNCEPTFAQKMYQEHIARYAFAGQLADGAEILDVGCGVGYGSQFLAQAGAKSVVGIDLDAEAIDHAQKHFFATPISYRAVSATALDYADQFDLVTCFELIEHVEEQDEVLDNIKAALRKDGALVISTPRPQEEIRTHFHVRELPFEQLLAKLRQRFKHVIPYFERNHFSSYVGPGKPESIERVVHITENFDISTADYFVFIATDADPETLKKIQSVLSMNDDSYVLNLEKDVTVLRHAENDHLATINHVRAELTTRQSAFDNADRRLNELGSITDQLNQLRQANAQLGPMITDQLNQLREANARTAPLIEAMQRDAAQAAQAAEARSAELDYVRRILAERSEALAEAQTRHYQLTTEIDQLRRAQREANSARAEAERHAGALAEQIGSADHRFAELQHRFDETNATLNRFRGSFSWFITRPLRWLARQAKRLTKTAG